jgi:tetratricopeptide (TPR) repeat protein
VQKKLLLLKKSLLEYLCEAEAWGAAPHDYAAIACYNLGMYEDAASYAQAAVDIDPADERLQSNLKFCKEKLT